MKRQMPPRIDALFGQPLLFHGRLWSISRQCCFLWANLCTILSSRFQKALRNYGVPSEELFQTADLFERRNIKQVTLCLLALARTVRGEIYVFFLQRNPPPPPLLFACPWWPTLLCLMRDHCPLAWLSRTSLNDGKKCFSDNFAKCYHWKNEHQ